MPWHKTCISSVSILEIPHSLVLSHDILCLNPINLFYGDSDFRIFSINHRFMLSMSLWNIHSLVLQILLQFVGQVKHNFLLQIFACFVMLQVVENSMLSALLDEIYFQ